MRIIHLVLFRFRPDALEADRATWLADLDTWANTMPGTQNVLVGPDVSVGNKNAGFTAAATMTFDDEQARDRYQYHPAHLALIDRLAPMLDQIVVVDLDGTPGGEV